ncbi:CPBP family intramembrane glutamic endopeptidase [Actinoalloteichus hymeniacidonis]|uniref:Metal-dependent membrane protease n=1 Tax=Actinoalloteichus hymeniacidonis TaxID=340345 RepID=A0AAC9MXR7_9PSEU|nr:CPBP family intramembrane glutamic endopeptidase [Actinoalloteichus hymeniacidonis]AOS62565.1 putative metal-dependent membrane protease [Actinoalloteichus hymeniacidonis]MBB5909404.1 hypothetical protein [Actinoalloteichus hymeniacidonis]
MGEEVPNGGSGGDRPDQTPTERDRTAATPSEVAPPEPPADEAAGAEPSADLRSQELTAESGRTGTSDTSDDAVGRIPEAGPVAASTGAAPAPSADDRTSDTASDASEAAAEQDTDPRAGRGPVPMPSFSGDADGWRPGSPVAVVPGATPAQHPLPGNPSFAGPPATPERFSPGYAQPTAAWDAAGPAAGAPAAQDDTPAWAGYGRRMGGIQDGYDQRLHERYWEAQLEAGARSSLHWGFLAFFVGWGGYYLTGMLLSAIMTGQFENFDQLDPPPVGPLLLLSLLPNLFLGLGPAVLSWWKGNGLRKDFGILPKWRDVWVGLSCGGAGLIGAFLTALMVMGDSVGTEETPIQDMGDMFAGQGVWVLVLALFMFIGAPLTEELLVRGGLWGALEHFKVPRYAILLLTTFVFALIHEEPMRTPILLVGGLAMGIARMITGRVSAAIIAHATYNFLPALIFYAQFS